MGYRNLDRRKDTFSLCFFSPRRKGWNGCWTVCRCGIWKLGERFIRWLLFSVRGKGQAPEESGQEEGGGREFEAKKRLQELLWKLEELTRKEKAG